MQKQRNGKNLDFTEKTSYFIQSTKQYRKSLEQKSVNLNGE